MKKLGILGGIGPEASSYFYSEIIRRLRDNGSIEHNSDYPQIIINSINAPELVSLEVTDAMLEPYAQGIRELAMHQPEYIVMSCNTIHLFRDRLMQQSGFQNISDISEIVRTKLDQTPGTICVLGTPATVSSGLYDLPNRKYVNPSPTELNEIAEIVVAYNAEGEIEANKASLLRIAERCRNDGASVFIAGCTEISELLRVTNDFLSIDTLELLIEDTLQKLNDL